MAVAFPYDQITNKPGAISVKVQSALMILLENINDNVAQLIRTTDQIMPNSDCNDPAVIQSKQLLQNIQSDIQSIQSVTNIVNTSLIALTVAARIASGIITLQLASTIPAIPSITQTLTVQNELVANIIKALDFLTITITIVNGGLELSATLIQSSITKLTSACGINLDTNIFQTATASGLNEIVTGIQNITNSLTESEFYNKFNTSDDDIINRQLIIDQLLIQQRNVLTDLIEQPDRVIYGTIIPTEAEGFVGDYYINTDTKTIYGPKNSDNTWPNGVNY